MRLQPKPILGLLIALLLFCPKSNFAQKSTVSKDPYIPLENTWWIQFSPLTFLEPELSITATGLYKINTYLGVALEAGTFILKHNYAENVDKYRGIRLKPEVKFYPFGDSRRAAGLYFSLQGMYKNTTRPTETTITVRDNNGQILFNQLAEYKEKKTVWGGAVKFGWEIMPGRSKRFMMDVYTGVGLRTKNYKAVGLPPGATVDFDNSNDFIDIDFSENGIYPTLSLGFKFGFRL